MGIFIGAVNGVLVTYMKLAPFIVTLGTGKIMQGLDVYKRQPESGTMFSGRHGS